MTRGIRGAGAGTRAIQQLADYADSTGLRIELTPSADFGGSKSRLIQFYKPFGFVENKGRNKDYIISETMYRDPQSVSAFSRKAGQDDAQGKTLSVEEVQDIVVAFLKKVQGSR